jgi:hypothetical protein
MGRDDGASSAKAESSRYFGAGQEGDMAFVRGNRALRDHAENVHLFEQEPEELRYFGQGVVAGWNLQDRQGEVDLRVNGCGRSLAPRLVPA